MICSFKIPSRGIIGLRNQLLTATAGEAIMNHRFTAFEPYKGEIQGRINGSLISMEKGTAIPYSLDKLQDRGKFFIHPGEDIYTGQVIGENSRADDLVVNVTVPRDPHDYIHRIGRTGRAKRKGQAITLVDPSEKAALLRVEELLGG